MKKSDENRYPHSADLFKFCKEALNIKLNFEVKVIDQHVGAILGYDPADCSHWKRGKKNIKSLQTIHTIASHLDADPRLVSDIVSGKIDLEESLQEYTGYGPFSLSARYCEEVKREYFRNPGKYTSNGQLQNLDQILDTQRNVARTLANEILAEADVQSCPVFIPELAAALPNVLLTEIEFGSGLVSSSVEENISTISFRQGPMRPHVRFLIAREIGRAFLFSKSVIADNDELTCVKLNHFASLLLIPGHLLQKAFHQIDQTRDPIDQLSEIFWVSRSIMNIRLIDFVSHGN